MNISPSDTIIPQINSVPNFKSFKIPPQKRFELKNLASGESIQIIKERWELKDSEFMKELYINILNNLKNALQLKNMAKKTKLYDIIYDSIIAIKEKNDAAYTAPFDIKNTNNPDVAYITGTDKHGRATILDKVYCKEEEINDLQSKVSPSFGNPLYSSRIIATIFKLIEPYAGNKDFQESIRRIIDIIVHEDKVFDRVKFNEKLAKKIVEKERESNGEEVSRKIYTYIDNTRPELTVRYENSGSAVNPSGADTSYYNSSMVAIARVKDMHFDAEAACDSLTVTENGGSSDIKFDNWNLVSGTDDEYEARVEFSSDGVYKVSGKVRDYAGNESDSYDGNDFTIDTTPPELSIKMENLKEKLYIN